MCHSYMESTTALSDWLATFIKFFYYYMNLLHQWNLLVILILCPGLVQTTLLFRYTEDAMY